MSGLNSFQPDLTYNMLLVGQKLNGLNSTSIRSFFSSMYSVFLSITFVVSFDNLVCEVGLNLPTFIFLLSLPDILLSSTTNKPRFHTISNFC